MVRFAETTKEDDRDEKSSEFLHREEIEDEFHDPYILKGYRKPYTDLTTVLKSCTKSQCNETFNVWSHALSLVYFTIRFYNIFSESMADPMYWPLFTLAVGIAFLFSMSTIAHALNCLSKETRHRCFYFDYAGISIYGMGTGQVFFFYCRKLHFQNDNITTPSFMEPYYFFVVSIATSVVTNGLMCATRRKWCRSKALFRTLSCVLPFAVNSFPYFYRLLNCDGNRDDCDTSCLPLYQKHAVYLVLLAVMNVSKFPERKYPGKFDAFGQSHHFVHIFILLASQDIFQFAHNEMSRRKNILEMQFIKPTFQNTILVTMIGIIVNVILALLFNADDEKKDSSKNK